MTGRNRHGGASHVIKRTHFNERIDDQLLASCGRVISGSSASPRGHPIFSLPFYHGKLLLQVVRYVDESARVDVSKGFVANDVLSAIFNAIAYLRSPATPSVNITLPNRALVVLRCRM